MSTLRIIGLERKRVETPVPHTHQTAIALVAHEPPQNGSAMVWAATDVARDKGLSSFLVGPPDLTIPVVVSRVACPACGSDVLQILPEAIANGLPHFDRPIEEHCGNRAQTAS